MNLELIFQKNSEAVLLQLTFYLEDDHYKSVDFNNETIIFTCQLIKIQYLNESRYD